MIEKLNVQTLKAGDIIAIRRVIRLGWGYSYAPFSFYYEEKIERITPKKTKITTKNFEIDTRHEIVWKPSEETRECHKKAELYKETIDLLYKAKDLEIGDINLDKLELFKESLKAVLDCKKEREDK